MTYLDEPTVTLSEVCSQQRANEFEEPARAGGAAPIAE